MTDKIHRKRIHWGQLEPVDSCSSFSFSSGKLENKLVVVVVAAAAIVAEVFDHDEFDRHTTKWILDMDFGDAAARAAGGTGPAAAAAAAAATRPPPSIRRRLKKSDRCWPSRQKLKNRKKPV